MARCSLFLRFTYCVGALCVFVVWGLCYIYIYIYVSTHALCVDVACVCVLVHIGVAPVLCCVVLCASVCVGSAVWLVCVVFGVLFRLCVC